MDLTDRFKDQFIKMVREYAVAIGRDYDQYYEPNFNNLAKLSESDLAQFFRSIDNQCVAVPGDGHLYVGGTRERIFDHGVKTRKPRYAKVCIEPVLSQGAIARLMLDYGWPRDAVRTQWGGGKFDLSVFRNGSLEIQCEIKASATEVVGLAQFLVQRSRGADCFPDSPQKLHNWSRKFDDLARNKPKLIWVLGPGGAERVLRFLPSDASEVLDYGNADHLHFDKS